MSLQVSLVYKTHVFRPKTSNVHEFAGLIGRHGSCIFALKQATYMSLQVSLVYKTHVFRPKTNKIHDSKVSLVATTHVFRLNTKQRT